MAGSRSLASFVAAAVQCVDVPFLAAVFELPEQDVISVLERHPERFYIDDSRRRRVVRLTMSGDVQPEWFTLMGPAAAVVPLLGKYPPAASAALQVVRHVLQSLVDNNNRWMDVLQTQMQIQTKCGPALGQLLTALRAARPSEQADLACVLRAFSIFQLRGEEPAVRATPDIVQEAMAHRRIMAHVCVERTTPAKQSEPGESEAEKALRVRVLSDFMSLARLGDVVAWSHQFGKAFGPLQHFLHKNPQYEIGVRIVRNPAPVPATPVPAAPLLQGGQSLIVNGQPTEFARKVAPTQLPPVKAPSVTSPTATSPTDPGVIFGPILRSAVASPPEMPPAARSAQPATGNAVSRLAPHDESPERGPQRKLPPAVTAPADQVASPPRTTTPTTSNSNPLSPASTPGTPQQTKLTKAEKRARRAELEAATTTPSSNGSAAPTSEPNLTPTVQNGIDAIFKVLSERRLQEISTREIIKLTDWDRRFSTLGRLKDFATQQTKWFEYRGNRVCLLPTAPGCIDQGLTAITKELCKHADRKIGYWDLHAILNWDKEFRHLGRLPDFIDKHSDWFETQFGVVWLKASAPVGNLPGTEAAPFKPLQPPTSFVKPQGREGDALRVIAQYLMTKEGLADTFSAALQNVRWGKMFGELGVGLRDFTLRHPECFEVTGDRFHMRMDVAEVLTKASPSEMEAKGLRAIVEILRTQKELRFWDLIERSQWDKKYKHLGKITDFIESRPEWFATRKGWARLATSAPSLSSHASSSEYDRAQGIDNRQPVSDVAALVKPAASGPTSANADGSVAAPVVGATGAGPWAGKGWNDMLSASSAAADDEDEVLVYQAGAL